MFYVHDFCEKKTNKLYDTIFLGCTACTQIKKLGVQRESLGAPVHPLISNTDQK